MNDAGLDDILRLGLRGVVLSSRNSSKFLLLRSALAHYWRVPENDLAVKGLGDQKNFGNRISEATLRPIGVLVLIAQDDLSPIAVLSALKARAVHLPFTVLVTSKCGTWGGRHVFLPAGSIAPFRSSLPITLIEREWGSSPPHTRLDATLQGLLALDGGTVDGDAAEYIEAICGGSDLVIKRISSSKQIGNRLGEALGGGPPVLALITPEEVVGRVLKFIDERELGSLSTKIIVAYKLGDILRVQVPNSCTMYDMSIGKSPHKQLGLHASGEPPSSKINPSMSNKESAPVMYRRLRRVAQLRKLLPLDSDAEHLYEEHLEPDQRLSYDTKTLAFLRGLLQQPSRVFIVLTGNAGHGKTHMCHRLLQDGKSNSEIMRGLEADAVGERNWRVEGATRPLRIIKDLSEIDPPEAAASQLERLLQQQESHVIVCANEGRMRDVVGRSPETLGVLIRALESGLERGATASVDDPSVHVVNLNFQAAAADDGGFLDHVLSHFLNHQSAWNVCGTCAAHSDCPILANREDLALSGSSTEVQRERRDALTDLVRIAEESGYVLTYRETLVLVAYIVTGNLSCEQVEELHRNKRKAEKLREYRLLRLLFEHGLSDDELEVLGILRAVSRLDPGHVALRPVDERLHRDLEESGDLGSSLFGLDSRNLHQRAELDREERDHQERLRRSRRSAWLGCKSRQDGVTRSERLGLRHHDDFRRLHVGAEVPEVLEVIRRLVRGLHTIQGASGAKTISTLHLVDPAFGRSGSHSAVIARSIKINHLDLWTESKWWRELQEGGAPPILDSVEWLDRSVLLVHRPSREVLLRLDLSTFEFVMNAANGVVMREFHSPERRRILRALARHAEHDDADSTGEVRVLLESGEGELTIERDQTIALEKS